MADFLPDEIWINILLRVSMEDRIRNVQFVNKRLHALCHDRAISEQLDFSTVIFMSEAMLMRILQENKDWACSISLKNCHWFSKCDFANFPYMPRLESLDVSGCFLRSTTLYRILKNVPSLKNLAISTQNSDLRDLFCRLNPTAESLNFSLDSLHIECSNGSNFSWGGDVTCSVSRCFFHNGSRPLSFSSTMHKNAFAKLFTTPSEHTLDYDGDIFITDELVMHAFCMALSCANLHHPLSYTADGIPSSLPRYDLSKIKFLSLPAVRSFFGNMNVCSGANCPVSLPSLQCLILPLMNSAEGSCYGSLKNELLYMCDYANLQCLYLTGNFTMLPTGLYGRIASLSSLTELHLINLKTNLHLLLQTLKNLKNLHTLSIFPDSRAESVEQSSLISKESYQIQKILPNLKNLELSQENPDVIHSGCMEVMNQISQLPKLEKLSLRCTHFPDNFSSVFTCLSNLKSVYFLNSGIMHHAIYPTHILSMFHNLTELVLHHEKLEMCQELFEDVSKCKNLEKLMLGKFKMSYNSLELFCDVKPPKVDHPPAFTRHILNLLTNCKRLHTLNLVAKFPSDWCRDMDWYKSERISSEHPLVIIDIGCILSHSFIKFKDTNRSFVFEHNPYNFPYSN